MSQCATCRSPSRWLVVKNTHTHLTTSAQLDQLQEWTRDLLLGPRSHNYAVLLHCTTRHTVEFILASGRSLVCMQSMYLHGTTSSSLPHTHRPTVLVVVLLQPSLSPWTFSTSTPEAICTYKLLISDLLGAAQPEDAGGAEEKEKEE